MRDKVIVGIYTRVSTQEQANEGYSISEQKMRLEKYAEAHDWIVFKWYNDPGFSGGKLERPGLKELIRDVKYKKLNKVLVYKLDRLSRSQKDTLYLIEDVFIKNDVDFISMTENFDTGTPLGRAMIGILSVFAQLEREQIKERMQIGLDARAREGYFHGGGYAPIGYDYINGELIINEYEAMQIQKIYDLCLSGMPVYSIYKFMNERYTHKYGSWSDSAVRSCLTSIIYTGKIKWKGEIYDGRHQAIIDTETFENAAKALDMRDNSKFPKHPFKRTTLLGGIIWCGKCGARYFCKQNVSKREDLPAQKYYTCYSRGKTKKSMIKDPNCKNKSWNIKKLDEYILNAIKILALDRNNTFELKRKNNPDNSNNVDILKKRINDIDKQINKLIDLYQVGNINFEVINNRISELGNERHRIENEMENYIQAEPELSLQQTNELLDRFLQIVNDDSQKEELTKIVHKLIDGIIIEDEDIKINWKFT